MCRAVRLPGDFHLHIANTAQHQTLGRILRELVSRTSLILMTYGTNVHPQSDASRCGCQQHRAPLDAIRLCDAREAARLMGEHLAQLESQLQFDQASAMAPGQERMDSILIGCFGDPGLLAPRQVSQVPVTGLAEASFVAAAAQGRFAIVTGGERWKPILERLVHSLGFGEQLAGIQTVTATGAELAANPLAAQVLLARACDEAVARWGVQSVILGGAGLAGMAAAIQSRVTVPVIDSVLAGVAHALRQVPAQTPPTSKLFDFAWSGVSEELAATGLASR